VPFSLDPSLTGSLLIILSFLLGYGLQSGEVIPAWFSAAELDTYALYILMLLIGILVGANEQSIAAIRKTGIRALATPVIAITGTAAGVLCAGAALSMDLGHALAVGLGLGYYSLSSVLIGEWVSAELAVIALLANIFRELLTILLAPLLARLFGPLGPLVSGGATASDTTLPSITKYSGQEYVPFAVFNGIVLTLLVPILVALALNL
jgi:uncharacterized membrane protein YbjE (DUF340 family)